MDLENCKLCHERQYGHGPVPGCGDLNSEVCLLGRNPGKDEDALGRPFVGRAGGKLNEGLFIAGLPRAYCRVTNVSKCMTPSNVKPTQQCFRICSFTWLKDELASMRHLQLIITLGNEALRYFERLATVGELHGTVFPTKVNNRTVNLFVSYHPSAALRSSLMDKHFTADMVRLRQYIEASSLTDRNSWLAKELE